MVYIINYLFLFINNNFFFSWPGVFWSLKLIVSLFLSTEVRMVLDNIEFASVFVGGKGFQYRKGENISTVWPGKNLPK